MPADNTILSPILYSGELEIVRLPTAGAVSPEKAEKAGGNAKRRALESPPLWKFSIPRGNSN
ncbi:MAG: hypothetical protein DWH78_04390 [Planctomycetota bacterium]|nr:MAG: hypothetical protein DWH78_04390 [Planctomycetota bacterium]